MKNLKKFVALALSAVMATSTMAACGGSSDDSDTGTLTFGCQNYGGGGIDPATEINQAWNVVRYGIGECLFKFNDSVEVENWLCDSYTVSDDHKTWVFHIRDGVKFSDGCDLTAQAVVDNFNRLFEAGANGTSKPGSFLEETAQMTADNAAGTVTIVTQTAYPDLTKNLAYPVMAILDVADTTDYTNGAIGTGPYAVSSFTEEVGYDLVANENYWDGTVPYEKVKLLYMEDASAKAYALQNGQVDLVENITNVSDLDTLKADSNYTVTVAPGVRCGFAYINQARTLGNADLRKAVLMAIDGQTMCDVTVGGLYTYGYSVLPSNLSYNYDSLTNPYAYNKDAATQLLDQAGITDTDGNGIRELNGQDITLEFITYDNRCLSDFAAAVQQQLKEIGINVNVNTMDSEQEWNTMVNGDYDLCSSNWTTVGTGDPFEYLDNWYGKSEANYCNYQNDEYDTLYEQLKVELDNAKRTEIITRLQQILIDDAAVMVHGYYNSSMLANSKVTGANIHTVDYYWLTTEIKPAS